MKERSLFLAHDTRRVLWLEGYIGPGLADRIERALNRLNRKNHDAIWFYLWSDGGDVNETAQICQLVDTSRSPVFWIGFNAVASAALVLTQSGSGALALSHTRLQFHRAHDYIKSAHDVILSGEYYASKLNDLARCDAFVLNRLLRRGGDARKISRLFQREACIRPAQAIRLKMLDGYYSRDEFKEDRRYIRKIARRMRRGSRV